MRDLHAWITQQVVEAEAVARNATSGPWRDETKRHEWQGRVIIYPGVSPVAEVDLDGSGGVLSPADAAHIVLHNPTAVLRRCEADRRILDRHTIDPDRVAFPAACNGCGNDDWGMPNVENINDCPELLDLAHAHGITGEELAQLDRPQPPKRMANVPASLRGPRHPTA